MVHERTVLQLTHFKKIGDNYHRLIWPAQQLARQMPHWRIINMMAEAQEHYAWAEKADLLVLSQSLDLDLLPVIERRRKRGLKTLAEYADNFYNPPPSSSAAGQLSSPLACQRYELLLDACDVIIVTGPGLKELLATRFKKEIHILENHYPYELPPFEAVWREPGDSFAIGWGGSPGHVADILSIAPLLRRLAKAHARISIHLMGDEGLPRYTRIGKAQLVFRNWGTIDEYFQFLDHLNLGVVPLIDTPFNRCRSDIKAIEMISRGVLPLLPPHLPYQGILSATGLKPYRSLEELEQRILFYLNNPAALQADARRLYEYVKEKRVAAGRSERLALYRRMMPEQPCSTQWDIGPGYHEVEGSRLLETPSGRILQKYANIQAAGVPLSEGLASVRQALHENPMHPELALLELSLSIQAHEPDWQARAARLQDRFPRDPRFSLLALRHEQDPQRQARPWQELLTRLSQEEPEHRAFYGKEIIDIMCRDVAKNSALLGIAQQLLEMFPGALPLKHSLALTYESHGEHEQALRYFGDLLAAKKDFENNKDYLSKVSATWLETWRDILDERCRLEENPPSQGSSH